MIEKIYIPTVNRVDLQITYNNLPKCLKKKVVFVVQAWEKAQYNYDCDYLVLPDAEEYHYSHYYCLPKTRLKIYEHGRDIKYAILDDDLIFGRRNAKYFSMSSNMDKSKRYATESDIIEMFELYDSWLNEPTVTVCGCAHVENPPGKTRYRNNASLGSALWINGKHFSADLSSFDLTCVRVMEDTNFLLTLLSRGYGNRVSEEFIFFNNSVLKSKTMTSTVWDKQTFEQTHNDHKIIQSRFPDVFKILYDDKGNRVSGGFRNYGKVKILWSKAYKNSKIRNFNNI